MFVGQRCFEVEAYRLERCVQVKVLNYDLFRTMGTEAVQLFELLNLFAQDGLRIRNVSNLFREIDIPSSLAKAWIKLPD